MFEYLPFGTLEFKFVEVIHVQLSYKRREVVVLEVLRENVIAEKILLFNTEAITFFCPCNDIIGLLALYYFKEFH